MSKILQKFISKQRSDYFNMYGKYPKQITLQPGSGRKFIGECIENNSVLFDNDEMRDVYMKGSEEECADYINNNYFTCYGIVINIAKFVKEEEPKEEQLKRLIRDMYNQIQLSHTTNQHNPYTWDEINPELSQRIKRVIK